MKYFGYFGFLMILDSHLTDIGLALDTATPVYLEDPWTFTYTFAFIFYI
jgi:hypothetical protein